MASNSEHAASERWADLCTQLGATDDLRAQGWALVQRLIAQDKLGEQGTQTTLNGHVVAAAYLASSKGKAFPGVSVTQLAGVYSIPMKEFFNIVLEQHARLYPGVELPELKPIKTAFLVSTVVHAKWKAFAKTLFPTGFGSPSASDGETTISQSYELGWLLWSLAKCHMPPAAAIDPLATFHLLAAIIHLLLALLPEAAQTSGAFWTRLEQPLPVSAAPCYPLPANAQKLLWTNLKAVPEEIRKQASTVRAVLTDVGAVLGIANAIDENSGALTALAATQLREAISPPALSATLELVRGRYAAFWASRSHLDDSFQLLAPHPHGRAHFSHSSPMASPSRPSTHAPMSSPGGTGRSSLLTPLRGANPMRTPGGAVPQTPMSSQLESVGWLRDAVATPLAPELLARYYDACERSPRRGIDERVERLCERVQEVLSAEDLSTDVAEQLELGKRLYYKMLHTFLQAEEKRLQTMDFSVLLSNASFHTSLLACCLESVFASYSTPHMQFPTILSHLDLQPFDFGKVIESFIKKEPHLPAHLKAHFADVEAKIVESLAWQVGSPLHGLMNEYDAALDAAAAAAAAPDGVPPPAAASRARAALEQFIKKCLYLAARRIQDICLRLLLPSTLVQQVWEVVKLVIDKCRTLLVGRHLDQVLMCSIYGVCKVGSRQVTFRHIIEQYKRQPGASPRTFREVRMRGDDDPPQDIIQFYNGVYIPAMKDHLLRVCAAAGAVGAQAAAAANGQPANGAPGGAGGAGVSSAAGGAAAHLSPDFSTARNGSSPRHVSAGGARELYVSSCTPNAHLTPRTRTLYAFSDTPAGNSASLASADRLRDINQNINGISSAAGAGDAAATALTSLSSMSQHGGGGSQDPAALASQASQSSQDNYPARGELDLGKGGGGSGVMASGYKRSRALMGEPSSRSGASSAASSDMDSTADR